MAGFRHLFRPLIIPGCRMGLDMKESPGQVVYSVTRIGSGAPDPTWVAERVRSVGKSIIQVGSATLLAMREEDGFSCFVLCPDRGQATRLLAANMNDSLGAKLELVDDVPSLIRGGYARLVARPNGGGRATQAGGNPAAVAEFLARGGLPVGYWVAVSLRAPKRSELSWARKWFDHQDVTRAVHYSREPEALVASVFAGGDDASVAQGVVESLTSALPGFDVDAVGKSVPGRVALSAAGLVIGAAPATAVDMLLHSPGLAAAAAAVPGAAVALVAGTGLRGSRRDVLVRSLASGVVPRPQVRRVPPGKPTRERTINGQVQPGRSGGYPLAEDVFLVNAGMVTGVVSPHHGSGSAQSVTAVREVPPALRGPIGPVIGWVGQQAVHISEGDRWAGVCAFGLPGSGKSVLVQNLFAYDLCQRERGKRMSMIAFENKGDGFVAYRYWMRRFRMRGHLVEVADNNTRAIELLPNTSAVKQAEFLVSALVYYWGEDAIAARSQNTLKALLPAAVLVTDEDADTAELPTRMSWVEASAILLGGRGDDSGVALAAALAQRANTTRDPELVDAVSRLALLYGDKVTRAQRATLQEAPLSKFAPLLSASGFFSPDRQKVTFARVLDKHEVLVINTGPASRGGEAPDEVMTECLSAMLMYGLYHAIRSRCRDWQTQGREVRLYSDELSLLSGSSARVIAWTRNQGRAHGVVDTFASQFPEQLPAEVRSTVLGFGTMFWMAQNNPDIIRQAVDDLTMDGSAWTGADLRNLERFHLIVRASVGQQPVPPVACKGGFWPEDTGQFLRDQGFSPGHG